MDSVQASKLPARPKDFNPFITCGEKLFLVLSANMYKLTSGETEACQKLDMNLICNRNLTVQGGSGKCERGTHPSSSRDRSRRWSTGFGRRPWAPRRAAEASLRESAAAALQPSAYGPTSADRPPVSVTLPMCLILETQIQDANCIPMSPRRRLCLPNIAPPYRRASSADMGGRSTSSSCSSFNADICCFFVNF